MERSSDDRVVVGGRWRSFLPTAAFRSFPISRQLNIPKRFSLAKDGSWFSLPQIWVKTTAASLQVKK
jgi:hypothetical protein